MRACNADGVWSDREATLAVTVLPYFWETRWFLVALSLMMLGAAAGTVWFVERRRFKRHLAELETQRAIERERLRISQDMHDDIGAEVTQLIMLGEMAGGESVSPADVHQQLRRMPTGSRRRRSRQKRQSPGNKAPLRPLRAAPAPATNPSDKINAAKKHPSGQYAEERRDQ